MNQQTYLIIEMNLVLGKTQTTAVGQEYIVSSQIRVRELSTMAHDWIVSGIFQSI
jgi:hypothetical protein